MVLKGTLFPLIAYEFTREIILWLLRLSHRAARYILGLHNDGTDTSMDSCDADIELSSVQNTMVNHLRS